MKGRTAGDEDGRGETEEWQRIQQSGGEEENMKATKDMDDEGPSVGG
jgi:hypothetical protein